MNIYNLINNKKNISNENNNLIVEENDICLITGKVLDKNFVNLDCNHKFSYEALFNEYINQKNNSLEVNKPLIYQTKCPYCRMITNMPMPIFKPLLKKYNNINNNSRLIAKYGEIKMFECEYIQKNNKQQCCANAFNSDLGIFCNKHYNYENNKNIKKINKLNSNKSSNSISKTNNIIDSNNSNNDGKIQINYNKLTVIQLKNILRENNCKVSGKKQELIDRINLYIYDLEY